MLSKSRFNRRIHAIYDLVINLFFKISVVIKKHSITSDYSIDSFPSPICENIRIARSKIVNGEVYRGFKASKRQYFYGFTVQIIATVDGIPVEFAIHPGSIHDSEGMKYLFFESLENSTIYGDSAYTGYLFEEQLKEIENIQFMIARKSNSKRKREPWEEYIINVSRKRIETMFSQISAMFPKRIHAVTAEGFLLKLIIFIFVL